MSACVLNVTESLISKYSESLDSIENLRLLLVFKSSIEPTIFSNWFL